jgi:hypothetical protein
MSFAGIKGIKNIGDFRKKAQGPSGLLARLRIRVLA